MKKICFLILSVFLLCSCSNTPESIVSDFLDAYADKDKEEMDKIYPGSYEMLINNYAIFRDFSDAEIVQRYVSNLNSDIEITTVIAKKGNDSITFNVSKIKSVKSICIVESWGLYKPNLDVLKKKYQTQKFEVNNTMKDASAYLGVSKLQEAQHLLETFIRVYSPYIKDSANIDYSPNKKEEIAYKCYPKFKEFEGYCDGYEYMYGKMAYSYICVTSNTNVYDAQIETEVEFKEANDSFFGFEIAIKDNKVEIVDSKNLLITVYDKLLDEYERTYYKDNMKFNSLKNSWGKLFLRDKNSHTPFSSL